MPIVIFWNVVFIDIPSLICRGSLRKLLTAKGSVHANGLLNDILKYITVHIPSTQAAVLPCLFVADEITTSGLLRGK